MNCTSRKRTKAFEHIV